MEITISKTKKLTISAIVIALYVVIMAITQSFSFGAIQIRLATSLYALAYIFPFLVLPLGLSNLLSNMLLGGLSIFDILGGGFVGIFTALLVYCVRKYKLNITFTILPINELESERTPLPSNVRSPNPRLIVALVTRAPSAPK